MIAARPFLVVIALLALTGCTTAYQTFFVSVAPSDPIEPVEDEPRVVDSTGDRDRDIANAYERGYALIGYSAFEGDQHWSPRGALMQARDLHAAIVVLSDKLLFHRSGVMKMRDTDVVDVTESGTVRTEGPHGVTVRKYSEDKLVHVPTTSYIAYDDDYYAQSALYFAPMQRRGFGVLFAARTTDDQRRGAGTSDGLRVNAVWKESPAGIADVRAGDLILSLDGKPIRSQPDWKEAYAAAAGRSADLVLLREGKRLTKRLTLPAGTW